MTDDQDITPSKGSGGRCSLADLFEPGHERMGANILARAIRYGYIDAFTIDYAAAKRKAEELAQDPDRRVAAAGAKLLVEMAKHDLKLLELANDPEAKVKVHEHRHYVVPPPRLLSDRDG